MTQTTKQILSILQAVDNPAAAVDLVVSDSAYPQSAGFRAAEHASGEVVLTLRGTEIGAQLLDLLAVTVRHLP